MQDDELLELCTYVREGQPAPNMLLAAVHHLLLNGKDHPLSQYYASLVDHPKGVEGVFSPFKQFCRLYREEIIQLLENKARANE